MDLEIVPEDAFAGDVFRAAVRWRLGEDVFAALKFVTARVVGALRSGDASAVILESVPVQLPVDGRMSEAVYRCTIPGDAVPSMRQACFEIEYLLVVDVYHSNAKSTASQVFEVLPVGLGMSRDIESRSRIIQSDMIRVDDLDDTAFGEIVRHLRKEPRSSPGVLEEVVERKICLLRNFEALMNHIVEDFRCRGKGDIYFYVCCDKHVDGGRVRAIAFDSREEVCRIEYSRILVDEDLLELSYRRNVHTTRILMRIVEYVNGELSSETEVLVEEFRSDKCIYRAVRVAAGCKAWFSLDCKVVAVRFFYRVVFDHLEIALPVTKASARGRIEIG